MPGMLSTAPSAPSTPLPGSSQQENSIRIAPPPLIPPPLSVSLSTSSNHSSSNSNHSASVVPPAMMDTYSTPHHHHHSPGPHLGGLATGGGGNGGGHHSGGHTPQTLLSMSSPSLGGHPHHPLSNVSVVTVASSSPSSDPKECIEEQCPVCGDRVSGYHYGLLTCESCKGFFKRTVQNKKVYTCVAERSCHIDKSQRKRCPYCRFQKCLEVGMKLEAVRADRMRGGRNKFGPMYKRDRARRLQILRQKQLTKVHHHLGGHGGGGGGHHMGGGGGHHHHHPPGATMLPGGELNFLQGGGPHGGGHGGGGGHHTTTLFDGIKQELIQIPQLSSSTSSPDSSPSPGSTAVQQGGAQGGPLSVAAAAAAAAAVAAGHGNAGVGHPGSAGGNGGGHHSFMPNLSISAHPMAQSNGGNGNSSANGGGLINPAAAAAAAAADHLLKSWANGSGGTTVAGTSKTSMSVSPYGGEGSAQGGGPGGPGSGTMAPGSKYLPPLVREFQSSMIDDKEWQAQLFGLLQNQTYNQCEVDLFELMCKVIDQSLFSQVDWARNSIFFKELKVDDQMKLLQHAWSDMLVLDHIHQRMHVGLPDDSTLPNGQKFDLLSLALLGVPQVVEQLHRVTARLAEIKVDPTDYICLKFLLLLNPEVRGLTNYKLVHEAHEQTKQALLEYTVNFYPQIADKFQQLLALVPEIRALTLRGEDFLYYKHINGSAPTQTLLMEMLHAKKK